MGEGCFSTISIHIVLIGTGHGRVRLAILPWDNCQINLAVHPGHKGVGGLKWAFKAGRRLAMQ